MGRGGKWARVVEVGGVRRWYKVEGVTGNGGGGRKEWGIVLGAFIGINSLGWE